MLACLVACTSATAPAETTEAGGETEGMEVEPEIEAEARPETSTRCRRRSIAIGEVPTDAAPTFTRELWLDFAISMADAVVEGNIDESGLRGETLCAEAREEGIEVRGLHPFHRQVRGDGIWLVVRAPLGYLVLNPERTAITRSDWDELVARSEPRSEPPTEEHASSQQIFRTIQHQGEAVWHGVEISGVGDLQQLTLYERGESCARIAFDADGIERMIVNPADGRGFMLQWARGALWRYQHYLDAELHGTSQIFERGTDRLRFEAEYRRGRVHGRLRRWDETRVIEDVVYEDGLITPVVAYSGPAGDSHIHYDHDGSVSYSATRDVMDAIRVGMRAREVSDLLKLPVSPAMGVRFDHYRCEEALTIRFRRGRVVERELLPNGAHCM